MRMQNINKYASAKHVQSADVPSFFFTTTCFLPLLFKTVKQTTQNSREAMYQPSARGVAEFLGVPKELELVLESAPGQPHSRPAHS